MRFCNPNPDNWSPFVNLIYVMAQNGLACTRPIGQETRADDSSAQGVAVKSKAPEQQRAQCTLHFPRQDGGMRNDAIKGRINLVAGRQQGEADGDGLACAKCCILLSWDCPEWDWWGEGTPAGGEKTRLVGRSCGADRGRRRERRALGGR